jgi:hypothetical protein
MTPSEDFLVDGVDGITWPLAKGVHQSGSPYGR